MVSHGCASYPPRSAEWRAATTVARKATAGTTSHVRGLRRPRTGRGRWSPLPHPSRGRYGPPGSGENLLLTHVIEGPDLARSATSRTSGPCHVRVWVSAPSACAACDPAILHVSWRCMRRRRLRPAVRQYPAVRSQRRVHPAMRPAPGPRSHSQTAGRTRTALARRMRWNGVKSRPRHSVHHRCRCPAPHRFPVARRSTSARLQETQDMQEQDTHDALQAGMHRSSDATSCGWAGIALKIAVIGPLSSLCRCKPKLLCR